VIILTPPAGSTGLTLVAAALPVVAAAVPLALAVSLACAVPLVFAVPLELSVALADLAVDAGEAVFEAAAAVFDSEVLVSVSNSNLQRSIKLPLYDESMRDGLPLFAFSCRLTTKPSIPMFLNDGGHGHADVRDVKRKSATIT